MSEEELLKFYNTRLNNVLRIHTEAVLGNKDLSAAAKKTHLDKIERMIQAGKERVYTAEEVDSIESEYYGRDDR